MELSVQSRSSRTAATSGADQSHERIQAAPNQAPPRIHRDHLPGERHVAPARAAPRARRRSPRRFGTCGARRRGRSAAPSSDRRAEQRRVEVHVVGHADGAHAVRVHRAAEQEDRGRSGESVSSVRFWAPSFNVQFPRRDALRMRTSPRRVSLKVEITPASPPRRLASPPPPSRTARFSPPPCPSSPSSFVEDVLARREALVAIRQSHRSSVLAAAQALTHCSRSKSPSCETVRRSSGSRGGGAVRDELVPMANVRRRQRV